MSREVKENKLESKYKSIILSRNKIEKKKKKEMKKKPQKLYLICK